MCSLSVLDGDAFSIVSGMTVLTPRSCLGQNRHMGSSFLARGRTDPVYSLLRLLASQGVTAAVPAPAGSRVSM
jgi:hypothetical protein